MATQTVALACIKSRAIFEEYPSESWEKADEYALYISDGKDRRVLLSFESFPDSLRYNKIVSGALRIRARDSTAYYRIPVLVYRAPKGFEAFDENVNWLTSAPEGWTKIGRAYVDSYEYTETDIPLDYPNTITTSDRLRNVVAAVTQPISIGPDFDKIVYISMEQPPQLLVTYDSTLAETQVFGITNYEGYINPHIENTIGWVYHWIGGQTGIGPIVQKYFEFYWRETGETTWRSGGGGTSEKQSLVIPAETFPEGGIEWKVVGVDGANQTSESSVYQLTTTDVLTKATPISPADRIVQSGDEIAFSWAIENSNGTLPTGADLQYSASGGAWTDFGHVDGQETRYITPAGFFSGGEYAWRVRAYNADKVAGEWSTGAEIVVLAAPVIKSVNATPVPFSTISWQAEDQQAYMLTVNGENLGTFFGTQKNHTLVSPLVEGENTVSVAVQNGFGLWSDPREITFAVVNSPGFDIQLSVLFSCDAALTWETESVEPQFMIYRDDVYIGSTSGTEYTDIFALGEHSYYVINVLPGGYYTKSNVVTGTMSTDVTLIGAAQNHTGWLELRLTANDPDEQIFSYQRIGNLRHFTGAELPALELSKYVDGSGTYDVAFTDQASIRAFEALKGQVVIIKSRGGNVIVGPMLQMQKRVGDFFTVFDFTVQRIAWEGLSDA